jgi:hypothetical protein
MVSLAFLALLFVLLAGGAAIVVLIIVSNTRGTVEVDRHLERSIQALAADFPEEVRARGGEEALRDPEFVSLWIKQLEAPNGPAAPDATARVTAPPPKLQLVLIAMLQRLLTDHQQVARRLQPPTLRIVIVSLLFGYVFGHFCGEVAYSVNHPNQNAFPHFYDFPDFDTSAYALGFALGIPAAMGLMALQVWLWYRRLRQCRAAVAERTKEIENDFSEVIRAAGVAAALKYAGAVRSLIQALKIHPQALAEPELRPQTRDQLRQGLRVGWLRQIHDGLQEAEARQNAPWLRMVPIAAVLGFIFGELFAEWVFALRHEHPGRFPFIIYSHTFDLTALLAGLGVGIPIGFLMLTAQWLLWRWQSARMQPLVQTCIHEFQADFADDLRTWGGPSVLRTSEAVQELLREHV